MEKNSKFVIYFIALMVISNTSDQIYVPDEGINQKPVTYTSGIKTSSYRKPFQIHHNYSRVYHQNSDSFTHSIPPDDENDETSQRPYPIYNAHTYGVRPPQSEKRTQIYVLNGTRIRKNENPTRQIVKYNKEKRSPKIEVYRTCPRNATGQFVYEFSCNQFLNCWKGRGFVQNCAPGTLFNPKSEECDFPEKVHCVSGPRHQTNVQHERTFRSVKQVGCPKEFTGLIPNYTDCSKFINCVSGIENLMDCPAGTLFDVDKNICDFAYKANCFNGQNQNLVQRNIDGKLDFSQSKRSSENQQLQYRSNEIKCPYGAAGLYKHPADCSKFLNCADGQTHVQDCAPGTLFNPDIKICDFPYNVRCENSSFIDRDDDATTIRSEWASGNTYYNQNRYAPFAYHNGTNNNYYNQMRGSSSLPGENLSGNGHHNQHGQTQYSGGSKQEFGYYSRMNGHDDQSRGYVSGYFDSSTPNYRQTDTFGSVSNQHQNNDHYIQNQYGKGSRQQETGIFGSDPIISKPDENVNTWSGYYPHNTQNRLIDNQNQRELGIYNTNGNRGQGSNIYSTDRYHKNENRGYQQPYAIKGSQNGQYHNIYQGQTQNNWRPDTYTAEHYSSSYGSGRDSNQYVEGSSPYSPKYGENGHQPGSESYGHTGIWRPTMTEQTPLNSYSSNDNDFTQQQEIDPYRNNQKWGNNQPETSSYNRRKPFSTQYPGGATFDQRNEWRTEQRGETGSNKWNSHQNEYGFQNQNTLDEAVTTANYDRVVNINQVRKTTRVPFRNSYEPFFGPTTLKSISPIGQPSGYDNYFGFGHGNKYVRATTPSTWKLQEIPSSQTNDYDDSFVPNHSSQFVRATTPQTIEKSWPPPFPSTDVNADYVFEYDDNDDVTLEAENSLKRNQTTSRCGKIDFRCSNDKCISKSLVCDSFKDCPDGEDETKCHEYFLKFSVLKDRKLAVLEKERWNNVSVSACALLCVESQKFTCRSFNYRKVDKTCFLTNTNEGSTGAIISYYPFDYYELSGERLNCSGMYVCENKKCIDKKKICDGADDCGDRMDEKGCKPQDYGYEMRLSGSKNKNEGYIQVTAFGKTGFVCDDQFGLRDANVVCRELGFHLGAVEVKGNSFFGKNFTEPFYMMDDLGCVGNETRLMDCDFSGWGVHNCLQQEIVGVVCKTPSEKCASDYWQCDTRQECVPLAFVCDGLLDCTDGSDEGSQHCDAPTEIRLVNGSGRQGRVEIRHHGIWGTICDDDFNEDAAKVVCRQLGYRGSAVVKKDAHFGSGSGPIWLDQVFCSGNETKVEDCSHWNWGEHNCEHSEDVGVICSNRYEYEERHQSVVSLPTPQTYPERCGYRNDDIFSQDSDVHFRVVRGSIAKKGDYPWQAAVRVKGKSTTTHWCGAVIISEKFVLTAAHCLIGYPKGAYVVVAGDYNVDEPEGTEQESFIEDYYLHENFRQGHKMNNDIALIKLKGNGFRLGGDVQAICLPDAESNYEAGQNCTISGFGSVESGKSAFSHNLRAGWVPLQKREICTMPHVYGEALTDGMFCAGSLDEGVDSCDGDSGGPLACLEDGVFNLYGITSWGQHCGYANKPGVYVKVAHYRKWIDDNFKKYSAS